MSVSLLARIAAARKTRPAGERKSTWSQPNFWAQPDPWLSISEPWSSPDRERIGNDFVGYVQGAYKTNGIVFACMLARQHIFSQIRFGWQEIDASGRPGDLVGNAGLDIITPSDLKRMESDAPLAGNYFATVTDDNGRLGQGANGPGRRLVRMRPDWVTIVVASPSDDPYDLRARVAGYWYEPMTVIGQGGNGSGEGTFLLATEVMHYAPVPDPEFRYRGMSPLTPILREIAADKSATAHKDTFFTNGARLSTVVKFDKDTTNEQFTDFVRKFNAAHQGNDNAYKTLFLAGGADVEVVGTDLTQVDFKSVQGGGETRVAAALRVHPVIVGLSEGMQGSSLNAGNYKSAKRGFVDEMIRSAWGDAAYAAAPLFKPPRTSVRLWYDDRDVAYLREDAQDAANILQTQATTANGLVTNGWEPDEVVKAVIAGDLRGLIGKHSQLFSVQLQPAGTEPPPVDASKREPFHPDDAPPKLATWTQCRGIKRFDPNQPRLPEGAHGGGRWLGLAITTAVFHAADGDVDMSALGHDRVLLSFEAGPNRHRTTTILSNGAAADLGHLLARQEPAAGMGLDVGKMRAVYTYPTGPDGKPLPDAMPSGYAHLKRTGEDTYELELLDTEDVRVLTSAEVRKLADDVGRMSVSHRTPIRGGDLDVFATERGRVGLTVRPDGGDPVGVELDARSWGRISYQLNGRVYEGYEDDGSGEGVDSATVKTNVGDVIVRREGPAGDPTGMSFAAADGSWTVAWPMRSDQPWDPVTHSLTDVEDYLGIDRYDRKARRT